MEMRIKINEKATLLLDVEQEMSIEEFIGNTSILTKLERYSTQQKNIIGEITGNAKRPYMRRIQPESIERVSPDEKKRRIEEWEKANTSERKEIAKKYNRDYRSYLKTITYYRRKLEGSV